MATFPLLLTMLIAPGLQADTSLFPPREALVRLYTNCDEDRWPYGTGETFVPKTTDELVTGVTQRRALEERWRAYFAERAGDSIAPTPAEAWGSPIAGVVVAAGTGWRGGYTRRRGFHYEGDGLSRRAGNGVMIFDPASGGYVYLIHFQDSVLVRAGDVVRRGQPVGRVGHTGNAAYPSRGKHLHFAFKRAGT